MLYDIKFCSYPDLYRRNLWYDEGFLVLSPGSVSGEILSPVLAPKLGYQWTGLDIEGSPDVEVAIVSSNDPLTFFSFKGGSVQPSSEPDYCNLEQIRLRLLSWHGDIRLLFRLTRLPISLSSNPGSFGKFENDPCLLGFVISCKILGEPLSYLADYGLPSFFRRSYYMERLVVSDSSGAIAIPSGFSSSNFSGITRFVTIPEKKILVCSRFANSNLLVFQPVLPNQQGYLTFEYTPKVESLSGNGFAQVTDIPSIFVKYLEDSQVMNVRADRWTTGQFGVIHEKTEQQRNLVFEVRLVAETIKDIRFIASGIVSAIAADKSIYLSAYAKRIPIGISRPLREMREQAQSSIIKESLASATLHLEVIYWEY